MSSEFESLMALVFWILDISITHAPSGQVLHKEVIALSVIKGRSDTVIDIPQLGTTRLWAHYIDSA
jgi:hypothetical protein